MCEIKMQLETETLGLKRETHHVTAGGGGAVWRPKMKRELCNLNSETLTTKTSRGSGSYH